MMLRWDEKKYYNTINEILISLNYLKKIKRIDWLTRVVSTDDEAEVRLVAKIYFFDEILILRVTSDKVAKVKERIYFQKILHQRGFAVPKVFSISKTVLSEKLTVMSYLEEYIDGVILDKNDFFQFAELLGKLHKESRRLDCQLSVQRNHILYDTNRIEIEMRTSFQSGMVDSESLIKVIVKLMYETKTKMNLLKRYPVHGDYATNNLIKKDGKLFLVDFDWVGLGYLPEEAGESLAEITYSCFECCYWDDKIKDFLFIYKKTTCVSELELQLIKDVAVISLVIRILHMDLEEKKKFYLCSDFLKEYI